MMKKMTNKCHKINCTRIMIMMMITFHITADNNINNNAFSYLSSRL